MKKIVFLLSLLLATKCFPSTEYVLRPNGAFTETSVNGGPYFLSGFKFSKATVWPVSDKRQDNLGTIEKMEEWSRGYSMKVKGEILCTHLSSYSFFECMRAFDVCDASGNIIGHIRGVFADPYASAEFHFFNEHNILFAKAVIYSPLSEFTISSADDNPAFICTKTLNYGYSTVDYYWKIKKVTDNSFDARFLWPFVTFISEVWWE